MLDPNTIRIGDRVRDLVASKAGIERLGSVIEANRDARTVRIVWDWSWIDTLYFSTWYLEPLERPKANERQAWTPTPSNS